MAEPGTPEVGDIEYRDAPGARKQAFVWNGTAWVPRGAPFVVKAPPAARTQMPVYNPENPDASSVGQVPGTPEVGDIDYQPAAGGRQQQVVWNGTAWEPRGAPFAPVAGVRPTGTGAGSAASINSAERERQAAAQREFDATENAARQKFDAEQKALDRAASQAIAEGNREMQRYVADQQAQLARERQAFDGWIEQMKGNITLRGQNIEAATAAVRAYAEQRGQDITSGVQQRGQDMTAQEAIINDTRSRLIAEAQNLQYLGDFAQANTKMQQAQALARYQATQSTVGLFGTAQPGQYAELQRGVPQFAPTPPPDLSGVIGGLQQRSGINVPRYAAPPTMQMGDASGGLGAPTPTFTGATPGVAQPPDPRFANMPPAIRIGGPDMTATMQGATPTGLMPLAPAA